MGFYTCQKPLRQKYKSFLDNLSITETVNFSAFVRAEHKNY